LMRLGPDELIEFQSAHRTAELVPAIVEAARAARVVSVELDRGLTMGDIPILKYAFSRTRETKTKTELLIFLTPKIVTDRDWEAMYKATHNKGPWGLGEWLKAAKARGRKLGIGE